MCWTFLSLKVRYFKAIIQRQKMSRYISRLIFIGPINFTHDGHGYFYSGFVEKHKDDKVDWLEGRNICREYCMDLVSLETPTEDMLIRRLIQKRE